MTGPILISLEDSILVNAPASEVWRLGSDPTNHGGWSDELVSAAWIDEPLEWETTSTVVTAEENIDFGWLVGDADDPVARWGFTLEARGADTLLRQNVRIYPRGLALTISQNPLAESEIIDDRRRELRRSLRTTLTRIQEQVVRQ